MITTPGAIKIDSHDPDKVRIREVADVCKQGKVIVFPTETVYGIGGMMSAPEIEKRLREIKGRSDTKPFAYHIYSPYRCHMDMPIYLYESIGWGCLAYSPPLGSVKTG